MEWLIKLLILAVSILIVGKVFNLYVVNDFKTAFIVAILLAIVNILIKPLLVLITLPITILTLGIFYFFINGFMLILVSKIFPEFKIKGCLTSTIAAILISLMSSALEWIFMIDK